MTQERCLVVDVEATGEPWNGKLICIGIRDIATGEAKTFADAREEIIIIDFLRYFNKHKFTKFIAYNAPYDYRQIVAKCIKYRIKLNDFQFVKIIDIMKLLKEFNHGFNFNKPGRLDDWSRYLIGQGKLSKDGSIKDLLAQGRIDEIIAYNVKDVNICYDIFLLLRDVMVI